MVSLKNIGGTAAIVTLLGSTASFSEVSANQIWDDWQAYMESFGYDISVGSEDASGNSLMITDITLSMDVPNGAVEASFPELKFTENGDGTVSITLPDEYPMVISGASDMDDEFELTLMMRQAGLELIASGDDAATNYSFSVPELSISLEDLVGDGETIDGLAIISMSGVSGSYDFVKGALTTVTTSMSADSMGIEVDFADPEGKGAVKFDGEITGYASASETTVPEYGELEELVMGFSEFLNGGLAISASMSHGGSSWSLDAFERSDSVALKSSSSGGSLNFTMSKDGIGYGGAVTDLDLTVSGSEIPLPVISIAAQEYAFSFFMPVSKSDTPEEFSLMHRLVGLTISDDIWGMFDPAAVMPRDPATLIVDLKGTANWDFDIFDPANAAKMGGKDIPGKLHSLTLNELKLSLAGVDLSGTGAFTFDNNDLDSFDGLPKPTGAIELALIGAEAMLGRLSAMGFLPEEQVMGARMMMGLFARPGEGEDSLVSKIEITEDGAIMANGQRLR